MIGTALMTVCGTLAKTGYVAYNDAQNRKHEITKTKFEATTSILGSLAGLASDWKKTSEENKTERHRIDAMVTQSAHEVEKTKLNAFVDNVSTVANAVTEWQKTSEENRTERLRIEKQAQVLITKLNNDRANFEFVVKTVFEERALNFEKMFNALDKAIESNNLQLIQMCFSEIGNLATSSPLPMIKDLLAQQNDPNAQYLTWAK